MLYPTLNELVEKVGSRYLLVNEVAYRARHISEKALDQGEKLSDKPVKLAILSIADGKKADEV